MKVLVTGGVRSGKSRHAEGLLVAHPAVTYVAPGPTTDEDTDPDWAERIATHRSRRPAGWTTLESRDLAAALTTPGPVLVDCLGTWLTAVLDHEDAWERPGSQVLALVETHLAAATDGLRRAPGHVVLVTNEVGLGVVPSHRSGRLFRDLLGLANQRLAAECDEVHLVVAGRVLVL
ncbi:bifunctional adenosylcobinamide kinase/adenosylcobinamide-phosphate guanylyltransferase [Nocardioides sp. LHG3406-4]|uniref:bifunctional adenosylcobinamide kinase/adenosylcobinamide-phosphate guanylyltransferase n=1 Tax=Nocardioides sp. LHG3406-4 TaxID=2804575 RepID=UPI003CE79025